QKAAKTRRVGFRNADILIKMKHLDPWPLDVRQASKHFQEFKLRCPGRGNDASFAPLIDRSANGGGSLLGCAGTQSAFVVKCFDFHGYLLAPPYIFAHIKHHITRRQLAASWLGTGDFHKSEPLFILCSVQKEKLIDNKRKKSLPSNVKL